MVQLKTRYGMVEMPVLKRFEKEHANFEFEKKFVEIIENSYSPIFVDIGAGWGYFTVIANFHSSMVMAFEPHNARRSILYKNVQNLVLKNVHISSKAVGTGGKKLYFNTSSDRGMVGPQTGIRKNPANVEWTTLEEVLKFPFIEYGGIIKIDVEGNELDVIKSAGDLSKYKLFTWLIERHQKENLGYSEEELFETMKPFKGELVGSRKWTYHYVFRMEE